MNETIDCMTSTNDSLQINLILLGWLLTEPRLSLMTFLVFIMDIKEEI